MLYIFLYIEVFIYTHLYIQSPPSWRPRSGGRHRSLERPQEILKSLKDVKTAEECAAEIRAPGPTPEAALLRHLPPQILYWIQITVHNNIYI